MDDLLNTVFRKIYIQNLSVITGVFMGALLTWGVLVFLFRDHKIWRTGNALLLCGFIAAVFYHTVLQRTGYVDQIILIPFHSLVEARANREIYRALYMNLLLFVPFGMLAPALWQRFGRRWFCLTLLSASLFSAVIEIMQMLLHAGRCEIDDVIANTIGAAIGALAWLITETARGRVKK